MLAAGHTIFAMPDVGGIFPVTQVTERAVIKTVIVSFQIARISLAFAARELGQSRITCGIQARRRRKMMGHAPATVISIVTSYRFQRNDRKANWRCARDSAPRGISGIRDLYSFRCGGTKSGSVLLANLVPC